ncbi:4-(cytidine 5'-diphospho)-2-C-methyl-D-erythritol kinase [Gulosibacter molinativorax]|uniref:4-diphosphocytidyl-2-C-methyl-D-erythritol kinase n=1 Tax=Gulosibacter molinativorax TaxID=256821 RepID=A0ABT7C6P6_9MICO|nr:4-(cytidine 5'-diphospho)-2-C-methyl-D-erythritol kinase [Gulosibacter molinativorax]MDJ1370849.1 4-(cytidine 5'-diphospho)-2-C-methyl-D-erythritol kinase [Gulosibacter molinativorax]QUY62187.1 4-diphosphocytidyl-2-C-methyl-D-erythritol kinase [Gulosibacter molinativorax]
MTTKRVAVRAPGKVNLTLAVGPVGADGYHPLATTFMALDLYEDVVATAAAGLSLVYTDGPVDASGLDTGEANLAIRAARLLAEATGHPAEAALEITKRVPIAGGMGGGSADAAATLVACDALWETNLTAEDLRALGAKLGSDVPFAMCGGVAVGTGRGDELTSALAEGRFEWVLRFSDEGMSTPATYRALDEHRDKHAASLGPIHEPEVPEVVLTALRGGDVRALADLLENDLQAPALRLRPDLAEVLEFGETHGALAGIVSGSGPTLAFLAEDAAAADALHRAFLADGHRALRASGPTAGALAH